MFQKLGTAAPQFWEDNVYLILLNHYRSSEACWRRQKQLTWLLWSCSNDSFELRKSSRPDPGSLAYGNSSSPWGAVAQSSGKIQAWQARASSELRSWLRRSDLPSSWAELSCKTSAPTLSADAAVWQIWGTPTGRFSNSISFFIWILKAARRVFPIEQIPFKRPSLLRDLLQICPICKTIPSKYVPIDKGVLKSF